MAAMEIRDTMGEHMNYGTLCDRSTEHYVEWGRGGLKASLDRTRGALWMAWDDHDGGKIRRRRAR